jgi:hypothetical protein
MMTERLKKKGLIVLVYAGRWDGLGFYTNETLKHFAFLIFV